MSEQTEGVESVRIGELEKMLKLSGDELKKAFLDFYESNIAGIDPEQRGGNVREIGSRSDEELKRAIQKYIEMLEAGQSVQGASLEVIEKQ